MHIAIIAALIGFGNRVLSQKIDLDFVKAVRPDPPPIKVPADRLSQPIVFDQDKAVANVIEDMRNNPLAVSRIGSVEVSDSVQKRQEGSPSVIIDLFDSEPACADLNGTLYGDLTSDSKEERVRKFLGNTSLHREAINAFTPENYTLVFQNMTNSTIRANGYLGYYVLSSYNTSECAQRCTDTIGCQAFNVYFERDPSLVPGPDCQNPPALLTTKCALWGGPISAGNALNAGQYRQLFHVVMSGSNGYVLSSTIGPRSTFAINAPLDCNGADTYMGFRLFNTSLPFSEDLCAAACEETTRNAMAPRPTNSATPPQFCAFYNTYILEKNSISQGQICAMYSQSWDSSDYATNGGQYDGEGNHFTIASSVFSGNVNLPPICPADLPDLRLDTEVSDFCTSYLPYNGPPTVTTTVTSASAAFSVCSTSTTGTTATTSPVARYARRAEPQCGVAAAEVAVYPEKVDNPAVTGSEPAVVTISGQTICSSGAFASGASEATAQLEATAMSTSDVDIGMVADEREPNMTPQPEARIGKRQGRLPVSTPTIFEGRDRWVISSACSRIVDTATKTAVETATPVPVLEPKYDCSNLTSTCSDQVTQSIISGQSTDDTVFDLDLPFEICIYDTCDTRVRPTSNGLITLGDYGPIAWPGVDPYPLQTDSTIVPILYVLYDDLFVDSNLASYMQYMICNDTPGPVVRFEWAVRRFATNGPIFSFSATFFSSQNNTVLLQYDELPNEGVTASIGAQGVRNGTAVSYTFVSNQYFAVAPFSTIINFDESPDSV